jgi:hypothetical protein
VIIPCIGCQSDAQPPSSPAVATVNAFASACLLFAVDPNAVAAYLVAISSCEKHRELLVRATVALGRMNGIDVRELTAKLTASFGFDWTGIPAERRPS